MLTRRAFPLTAAAATAALTAPALFRPTQAQAALPVPPGDAMKARVMRNGSDIGTATYAFARQGNSLRVNIAVDLVVKLGPIAVFRYTHRNVETWEGDTLAGIDAKTDDDGTPKFCTATRTAEGLRVNGSRGKDYIAPPGALATTYWNFKNMSAPLVDSEDGHLLNVRVTPLGARSVEIGTGATVSAREFEITGDMHVEVFYDAADTWQAMNYYAKDKSIVRYQRL